MIAERTTSQSRLEVFWRTLLHNHFDGMEPAPAHCSDDILADMKLVMYALMASALSHKGQSTITGTKLVDWQSSRNRIAQLYTTWKKLLGLCPWDMDGVVYPPGFKVTMERLGSSWNYGTVSGKDQLDKFCELVVARVQRLAVASARRVAARNRAMASSIPWVEDSLLHARGISEAECIRLI
jgi:hypothetical protein